jgi:hypothetical protein
VATPGGGDRGRAGYVTQIELIGTDNVSSRVEAAFEYDGNGNVVKAWKGDTSYTGTNAVNRQELHAHVHEPAIPDEDDHARHGYSSGQKHWGVI